MKGNQSVRYEKSFVGESETFVSDVYYLTLNLCLKFGYFLKPL